MKHDTPLKKLIVVLLTLIVLICVVLILYVNSDGTTSISAMDAQVIADDVANNWNENATLLTLKMTGQNSNGLSDIWSFKYVDSTIIYNSTTCVDIKIYSNGSNSIRYNASHGSYIPLGSGWIIDSSDAYDVAQGTDEIRTFLRHNPYCDSFALRNEFGILLWDIEWAYDAGFDDPKWAQIQIDANTGEILHVEVDD